MRWDPFRTSTTFWRTAGEAAARATIARLTLRGRQIEQFPESGRSVPEAGNRSLRELVVGPYRLLYRLTADGAEVVIVVHGCIDLGLDD